MHGLNASFTRSPELFVRQHLIQESQDMVEKKPSAGVYDFDFSPGEHPKLALFDTAPSGCNLGEPLVKAFWLPWESGATIGLELDTQAEVLFDGAYGRLPTKNNPCRRGRPHQSTAHSREYEYLR